MMKWVEILFWIVICGVAGLGCYFLFDAIYLSWHSAGPLFDMDLRLNYILEASLRFVGFLVYGGGVVWLLKKRRGYMDQFLVDEE